MDMEYVRTEVCTERHQRNREELKTLETRVNNHGKELDALSVDFAEHVATQAEINRQTLEQLKELQKRTAGTGIGNHRELGDAGAAWTAGSKNRTLTPKGCYFFRRKNK